MDFELPEDITALDDEQLSDALAWAIAAFDAGPAPRRSPRRALRPCAP
ncbi:hypothetical protein [Streptomyces sp. NPDC006856]